MGEPASKLTAVHMCETDEGWRPCPPGLCEAERLASALEQAGKTLALLLDQPAVRALDRDAYGVRSNIGPYQLARDALAALGGTERPWTYAKFDGEE